MSTDVSVVIDPELRALCPPLSTDEYQQLEANLLADGCRDPLVVWPRDGAVILVDGHHRYAICERQGLAYTVHEQAFASQEEAINWMIALQLGRRNLTQEQKSYLRGKRFQLEKKREGRPEQLGKNCLVVGPTRERLAEQYHVAPRTIQDDAAFADAIDTLEDQVRADIRETVLKRQDRGKQQATKKQATRAGKLVQERKVEPLPFMRRDGWKPYHVLEAIEILGTLPLDEHPTLNTFLDQPFLPGDEGVGILRHLAAHRPEQRHRIYALRDSSDPREYSLALTLAAKKAPAPDPQSMLAGHLVRELDAARHKLRTAWLKYYPQEPWSDEVGEIERTLASVQTQLRRIGTLADTAHQERIARHAEAFLA